MLTEELLHDLQHCDEYSLRHYQSEISELIDTYRKLRADNREMAARLRELTADAGRWLVLNRTAAGSNWLRAVPASVVRRTAMAAMAHDAALTKIPPAEVS